MPRQNSLRPYISGRIKDEVYYYRKDRKNRPVYYIRQAPKTVTQTTATKRAASEFGIASKSSKLLRDALYEHTRLCYDNRLHERLNSQMAEILRADAQRNFTAANMQSLQHFQFNSAANIHQLLKRTPVFEINDTCDINISLPGTFSNSKNNATHISITAIALSVNFVKGTTRKLESNTVVIRRGQEFSPVTMKINRRGLTLIILEVQSFYEVNGKLHASQNKQGQALDIISVLAPVEQLKEQKRKYKNKAPQFWVPYAAPATSALIITPVSYNSLPEG